MRGTYYGCLAFATVFIGAAIHVSPAVAQTGDQDLRDVVRQQAQQIQRLKERLDAVEDQHNDDQVMPAQRNADADRGTIESDTISEMREDIGQLKKSRVNVDWSGGAPKISSSDGEHTFEPIGRIQYDFSTTNGSRFDGGDTADRNISGGEFRRVRLGVQGRLMKPIDYRLEIDFAGSDVAIRDAFISAKHDFSLGQGVAYVGNKYNDRSLSGATSSKWIWFLERNKVSQSIKPESGSFNLGLTGAFYGNGPWHLSAAVSKGNVSGDHNDSDNLTLETRGHFNPVVTDNATLHAGAWGFYEDLNRGKTPSLTDNVRVASHFNDRTRVYADTVNQPESSTGYGLELAGLTGRLAAGLEYGRRDIDSRTGQDTHYDAYSGQIGYSLSGEAFGYSTKKGAWTRPDIDSPVTHGGWGVWQLMARYDALDYENSGDYAGGTGYGTTVGLNWYLNDYMRVMLNWINWNTRNRVPRVGDVTGRPLVGSDDGNTVAARAQVVF